MSRVTRAEWYQRVNDAWPADIPELTADEATRAARKLFRFATGRTFTGQVRITSGQRFNRIARGTIYVNPQGYRPYKGWVALVHDLSHYLKPCRHGGEHARFELRMIKEVIKRGWLTGVLRSVTVAATPDDKRAQKIARLEARLKSWETKQRRATNAIKRITKSLKYYQREI